MKIYDIAQEVFGCVVFPGDPSPERIVMRNMEEGSLYNLTAFQMCAHNGTHVDAPYHFINDGKTIEQVALNRFVGYAYVTSHEGKVTLDDAKTIFEKAKEASKNSYDPECDCYNRILVKGNSEMTEEAARYLADNGIFLYGNESQTVGPENAPMAVHLIMLGAEVVLLEGIRLSEVPEGMYLLNSAPINLAGSDGAPARPILISL